MKTRLVYNISDVAWWRRRPVGIIRVTREIAKSLHNDNIKFECAYLNRGDGSWKSLPKHKLDLILDDNWVLANEPDNLSDLEDHTFPAFIPQENDTFISLGSDWSHSVPDKLIELYQGKKNWVTACHDIIPIIHPELTPGPEFYDQFNHHYSTVAKGSFKVWANSENSKNDLISFWKNKFPADDLPEVFVETLPCIDQSTHGENLTEPEAAIYHSLHKDSGFVLYVSTIEPRKNHRLLLHVWRELFDELGKSCPTLVFVGMRGWGCSDMLEQMERMAAYKCGKIRWLEGVSDSLLIKLYESSLFNVFPSIYEGFGLSAAETMAAGKFCVVSNNSSLKEATQGLADYAHPFDYPQWKSILKHLIIDNDYLLNKQKIVKETFKKKSWAEFSRNLLVHIATNIS